MSDAGREQEGAEHQGPVVRDRRKIDPQTFQAREPQDAAPAPGGAPSTTAPASPSTTWHTSLPRADTPLGLRRDSLR